MGAGVEHWRGGILSLCRLIDQYGEAVEYDLLMSGRSLDEIGYTLSWRDLWVLVRRWQKTPRTALSEAIHGHMIPTLQDELLAGLFDLTAAANWQRAGKKGAPKPKPLKRPWWKPKTRKLGSGAIPASEFTAWWDGQKGEREWQRRALSS